MSTDPVEPVPPKSEATRAALYEPRSAFIAESSEEFADVDVADALAVLAELRQERKQR